MNTTVIFCFSQSSPHLVDHPPALLGALRRRLIGSSTLGSTPAPARYRAASGRHAKASPHFPLAGKIQQFHRVLGAFARLGQRETPVEHAGAALVGADRRQHRLMHCERGKNTRDLKRPADAVTHDLRRRTPGHVDAIEQDLAGVGPQRAGYQVEECALAGAIGTDHGRQRTVGEIKRNIVGRLDAAE
jgi:hypothetical protein